MIDMIEIAKHIALEAHRGVNQKYDSIIPYEYHLEMVAAFAYKYGELVANESFYAEKIVQSAAWLHDSLEDTFLTYNDLEKHLSEANIAKAAVTEVIEVVFALTNDKGRNRKERAGDNYYKGIGGTRMAIYVKLCDRLANVAYGKMKYSIYGSGMYTKYRKEQENFISSLAKYDKWGVMNKYLVMIDELEDLLK